MRNIARTFVLCFVLLTGCDPKMIGPVGDIFNQEYYWELEAYYVRGDQQPSELANEYYFLSFPDNINKRKEEFYFWNVDKERTISWLNQNISFDVHSRRTIGTYIKKTESGQYFKATVFTERPASDQASEAKKLEISNLMDGGYESKNDTVRYVYGLTEKF